MFFHIHSFSVGQGLVGGALVGSTIFWALMGQREGMGTVNASGLKIAPVTATWCYKGFFKSEVLTLFILPPFYF